MASARASDDQHWPMVGRGAFEDPPAHRSHIGTDEDVVDALVRLARGIRELVPDARTGAGIDETRRDQARDGEVIGMRVVVAHQDAAWSLPPERGVRVGLCLALRVEPL